MKNIIIMIIALNCCAFLPPCQPAHRPATFSRRAFQLSASPLNYVQRRLRRGCCLKNVASHLHKLIFGCTPPWDGRYNHTSNLLFWATPCPGKRPQVCSKEHRQSSFLAAPRPGKRQQLLRGTLAEVQFWRHPISGKRPQLCSKAYLQIAEAIFGSTLPR